MSGLKRSRLKLSPIKYKQLALKVLQRDEYKCQICRSNRGLTEHHIVFRSQGGDDASHNLVTLCWKCHSALHSRRIVILPLIEGHPIDADRGIRWMSLKGANDKRKKAKTKTT